MTSRLAFALQTAYEAGRLMTAHFQRGLQVDLKADDSPVTLADRAGERFIREAVEKAFPGETILGEEEGLDGESDDRWIVDPIDGTKSFISGVPLYATLLSYEQAGEPIVGVAYFPALDEMVYAEKGSGCFLNGRPCRVSQESRWERSVLSFGGPNSLRKYGRIDGFLELSERVMATRTWSDAYGHALVATGRIEGMADPIVNRWDISAMSLIVREAGGRCTNFLGEEGLFNEALSSNGLLHQGLIEAFRK